jgi:protein-S-isoprenylcysteine O-methyltransferase Ste14
MNPKSASLVATGVLVLAVLGLLVRHSLFGGRPIAVAAQILAAGLMLAARLAFGWRSFHAGANPTEGGLVTHGPYRFIRHPIYSAVLLFVWAGALSHASALTVSLAALASAATAVRIRAEERLIVERYPEYAAYAARVKRVIPFIF